MADVATIRRAVAADLPAVVRLFATPDEGNAKPDDPGPPLDPCYRAALEAIARDADNMLIVADKRTEGDVGLATSGTIVGVFHLTFIQYVAYKGGLVAQIENVVVAPALRGRGVGEAMMRWAIDESRRRGAYRIQLTTNKVRKRAHRFYERLGFVASHEGMKLVLPTRGREREPHPGNRGREREPHPGNRAIPRPVVIELDFVDQGHAVGYAAGLWVTDKSRAVAARRTNRRT